MIPKKIHQVWIGDKPIPEEHKEWIEKIIQMNPGFEYKMWKSNEFGENKFTKAALDAGEYAYYSDWIRANILYQEGGIYFDTDIELLKPIPDYLLENPTLPLETDHMLSNYIVSVPKKSRFMKNLIELYESYDDEELDVEKWVANKVLEQILPKTFGRYTIKSATDGAYVKNPVVNFCRPLETAPFYPFGQNYRKLEDNITSDTWCIHHWNHTKNKDE